MCVCVCVQIASFLLYLSDVEEGGETMFPYEVRGVHDLKGVGWYMIRHIFFIMGALGGKIE